MMSSIIQQVLIKDMKPYQVEQWATLLQPQTIENFVTVVAVKDVEFIDVTTADDGNTVINCLAFDDTVVSVRHLRRHKYILN